MGVTTYTTIDGELLSESRGGVSTLYVPDALGSLVEAWNGSGNVLYSADYWAYGETAQTSGANPSLWGFVGLLGYLQDIAGLLYVRARHYRPPLARWQTVDPLWPNESAYGYVNGIPVVAVDPTGLAAPCPSPDCTYTGDPKQFLGCLVNNCTDFCRRTQTKGKNRAYCVAQCLKSAGQVAPVCATRFDLCQCDSRSNVICDPCFETKSAADCISCCGLTCIRQNNCGRANTCAAGCNAKYPSHFGQ